MFLKLTDIRLLMAQLFNVMAVVSSILFVAMLLWKTKKCNRFRSGFIVSTVVMVVFGLSSVLLPTTKEFAAIVITPKIVNSDLMQHGIYGFIKSWVFGKEDGNEADNESSN